MKRKLNIRTAVWTAVAALTVLSLSAGAGAVQGDKKIRLLDDCEPISFNAVVGPGTCVGNGHTTFDEFIAELAATQDVHKWRNQPSQMQLNIGRPTLIENRGGEDHTFTEVVEFGGGAVEALNGISGNPEPAPECLDPLNLIHPGTVVEGPTAGSSDLPVGTHRFQCCIHPWMRTVIDVSDNKTKGGPPAGPSAGHHH
jgi:hypothetical protein